MSAVQVETYEVDEVNSDLDTEEDGSYLAMIDRLGLKGQRELVNPETKQVSPYRKMTDEEFKIFKILFPKVISVENYSNHKIPIRVLQVYEHAKSLELYEDISVWDEPAVEITDPVLVGKRKAGSYNYVYDILARWGSALASVEELRELANKKAMAFLNQKIDKLETEIVVLKTRKDAFNIVKVNDWNGCLEEITIDGINYE